MHFHKKIEFEPKDPFELSVQGGEWENLVLVSPQTTPRFGFRRTHGTRHIVVLRAEIYSSERTQTRSAKGKGAWGEIQRKPGGRFELWNCAGQAKFLSMCEVCLPGKLRDPGPLLGAGQPIPKCQMPRRWLAQSASFSYGQLFLSENVGNTTQIQLVSHQPRATLTLRAF